MEQIVPFTQETLEEKGWVFTTEDVTTPPPPVPPFTVMPPILLNGLLWDTVYMNVEVERYFDTAGAVLNAAAFNRRIPTIDELRGLLTLPRVYDAWNGGWWVAETLEDLRDVDKSLFLPLVGNRTSVGTISTDRTTYINSNIAPTQRLHMTQTTFTMTTGLNAQVQGVALCVQDP